MIWQWVDGVGNILSAAYEAQITAQCGAWKYSLNNNTVSNSRATVESDIVTWDSSTMKF